MVNLEWAKTYISGYAMHNSIGIVAGSAYALHTLLCVFAQQLASEYWAKVPLSLFAAPFNYTTFLLMSSSSLTCWDNCTRTSFRKTFDGAGCLNFSGKKEHQNTKGFVATKNDFVFSSIVTTNMQKTLKSTNARANFLFKNFQPKILSQPLP